MEHKLLHKAFVSKAMLLLEALLNKSLKLRLGIFGRYHGHVKFATEFVCSGQQRVVARISQQIAKDQSARIVAERAFIAVVVVVILFGDTGGFLFFIVVVQGCQIVLRNGFREEVGTKQGTYPQK